MFTDFWKELYNYFAIFWNKLLIVGIKSLRIPKFEKNHNYWWNFNLTIFSKMYILSCLYMALHIIIAGPCGLFITCLLFFTHISRLCHSSLKTVNQSDVDALNSWMVLPLGVTSNIQNLWDAVHFRWFSLRCQISNPTW